MVVVLICVAIKELGSLNRVDSAFVTDVSYGVAVILCMVIMFGPKTYMLFVGVDLDERMRKKKTATVAPEHEVKPDELTGVLMVRVEDCIELLRKGSAESNRKMCEDQIAAGKLLGEICTRYVSEWREALAAVESGHIDTYISAMREKEKERSPVMEIKAGGEEKDKEKPMVVTTSREIAVQSLMQSRSGVS